MQNTGRVKPHVLARNSRFKFSCHRDIKCFKKCCRDKVIRLNPYDVLMMKRKLGISSGAFLEKYTCYHIDEKTSLMIVILRMRDDEEKTCPFVTEEGCGIYSARPAECRYYPLGEIFQKSRSQEDGYEASYFVVQHPECFGFRENVDWTVENWRVNQGVDIFDSLTEEWKKIMVSANISGECDQANLYIASYDLDRLRSFIFESGFLDVVDMGQDEIDRIANDEISLMKFGFKYLKHVFNMEETLKLKEDNKQGLERIKKGIMRF